MKRVVNIIVVIVIITLIVLVLRMNKKNNREKTSLATVEQAAVPVQVDVVKEEYFTTAFISNGTLEPVRELAYVSDVTGRIMNILADKGAWVSKGQTLIQVDDEMLKADFQASQAAYNALLTDHERFKNANEQGGVTNQQLDNIHAQLIAAESRYLTSKRRLADAAIKSPIAGYINERYVEVGTYLNPGMKLFDIIDDSQLKLRCNITESQVLKVRKGQDVTVTGSAFPGVSFNGRISFIGAMADRGLSYPIEITIGDKKGLKAGMYVTAHFMADTKNRGILIPRSAVSGSVKSASVFLVQNGIARHRDVLVGEIVEQQIEITEGLQPGDSIIVAGLINVSDGVKVAPKN